MIEGIVVRNPAFGRFALAFGLSTAAGVFLGLIGPFGSYLNDTAPTRIAYSVGTFWIATLLYGVAVPAAARWASGTRIPLWVWGPVVIAIVAIPVAAVSRVAALSLWPFVARVGLLEWYGQSLTISVASLVGALLVRRAFARSGTVPVGAPAIPADRIGPDVLCLQMEDHYVRVHTPRGSDLVLMPMARAVAAMADREGLRVHRSWWVARDAVEAVVPAGRQWKLRLKGGLEAPVSRTNTARLREAGWL